MVVDDEWSVGWWVKIVWRCFSRWSGEKSEQNVAREARGGGEISSLALAAASAQAHRDDVMLARDQGTITSWGPLLPLVATSFSSREVAFRVLLAVEKRMAMFSSAIYCQWKTCRCLASSAG